MKIVFDQLQQSDLYKKYLDTVEDSYKVDKAFVINFFKEIIAPNDKLADYFEGNMISWVDDIPFVNTWVVKTLSKQKEDKAFVLRLGQDFASTYKWKKVNKIFNKSTLLEIDFWNMAMK